MFYRTVVEYADAAGNTNIIDLSDRQSIITVLALVGNVIRNAEKLGGIKGKVRVVLEPFATQNKDCHACGKREAGVVADTFYLDCVCEECHASRRER